MLLSEGVELESIKNMRLGKDYFNDIEIKMES